MYRNIDPKYGETGWITLAEYQDLGPESTFQQRKDGIYEVRNGRWHKVAEWVEFPSLAAELRAQYPDVDIESDASDLVIRAECAGRFRIERGQPDHGWMLALWRNGDWSPEAEFGSLRSAMGYGASVTRR